MKNNKGFSLVELIIVIAIMAILVGVMAPQLIKYIEKSKVSADTQVADSVHTAILTAMMDPEVVNNTSYQTEWTALSSGTKDVGTDLNSTSPIGSAALEIMDLTAGGDIANDLKSAGASDVKFQIVGNNKVSVWIPNTDSRGSKDTSGTYAIVVD